VEAELSPNERMCLENKAFELWSAGKARTPLSGL